MKLVTVVGARPQFIKAAMLSRAIRDYPELQETIIHTGQHFDANMSDLFFQQMSIRQPDYNLNVHSLPHGAMTGQMMEKIEAIIQQLQPDAVIVYGDTDSTLAGALAAKKMHIPLVHVEAGLRSFNMRMPEEINRVLTDRIADLLFCPTPAAVKNLRLEGLDRLGGDIILSGDLMKDAALHFAALARKPSAALPDSFALCTLHRAENTDNPAILQELIDTLEKLSHTLPVVLPLHPRTRQVLRQNHYDLAGSPIRFIEPAGYLEMLYLLQHCNLVLTDSGGLQKEAYLFHKPCLTLRNETEWVELAQRGYNRVVGHDGTKIMEAATQAMQGNVRFSDDLYGDGRAAQGMVDRIVKFLSAACRR